MGERGRRRLLDQRWENVIRNRELVALGRLIDEDFEGFCKFLVRITDRSNRLSWFEFGRVQRVLDAYCRRAEVERRALLLWVLKGRQFGCSTFFAVRGLREAAFRGRNALELMHLEAPGFSLMAKVELALKHIPGELVAPVVRREKSTEIRWDSSVIKRESAERVDAGVSETYQHLHLTEIPLWKDASATMHGLLPTVPRGAGSTIVGEFTARSVGDYTHGFWLDSVRGETGFEALFLPWTWHEEYELTEDEYGDEDSLTSEEEEYRAWAGEVGYQYPLDSDDEFLVGLGRGVELSVGQLMWRRNTIRAYRGDVDKFRREFPLVPDEAFATGGNRVFAPSVMGRLAGGVRKPVRRGEFKVVAAAGRRTARLELRDDGRLWVWENPVRGVEYAVGADSSSGRAGDSSSASVVRWDGKHIRLVASMVAKLSPPEFAKFLRRLGAAFNMALIVPERNFHGAHVIDVLTNQLEYTNVYRHASRTSIKDRMMSEYGFPTSKATKMPLIHKLDQAASSGGLVVPCERTISEMRSFEFQDGDDKAAAAPGTHDDMVISLALAVWGVERISSTVQTEAQWESADGPVVSQVTGY